MKKADDVLTNIEAPVEEKKCCCSQKKLRIGIIGTGWIADSHIMSYKNQPDAEIVAGADLIPGKADAFFKKHGMEGVRTYPDHLSMLQNEELDAVSVCTYNATHAVCTIDALNAGVNVMLEKPMCVTLEEAVAICKAEKASGKVLSIGFQPRFDANMQMIKKIVESGELGQIYYIQTGGGRRRGIPTPFGTSFIEKETGALGALGDIGCYSLDMVLNAIGYPKPLTVTGYTSDFFGKNPATYADRGHPEYAEKFGVDDFAAAFVRLEGGIILDFRIAWAMNINTPGDTIILGTKGGLRIPSTDCWNGTVGGAMTIYHEVAGAQTETTVPIIENKGPGLFEKKIRSFMDACYAGGPAPVPASQILYNQAILDGINRSAKLGREIEIEIPEI
ncbi:MAG: Gfo/Idh/MocA family oxidoreductase [Clostridia bacterium]|nr:Gfo/Idh/MocA family oxidoreductase [Oscillospiraceae bacterium]MBR6747694.1 Gfo/Idh/MocA family oxidoreductase [Clostridia bacterium]